MVKEKRIVAKKWRLLVFVVCLFVGLWRIWGGVLDTYYTYLFLFLAALFPVHVNRKRNRDFLSNINRVNTCG
jgi:hypothetical protein